MAIILLAGFVLDFGPQSRGLIPILGGLLLLVILFSYDEDNLRTGWQSFAWSGVAGFCAAVAIAPVPDLLTTITDAGNTARPVTTTEAMWRALLWLGATFVFALIDRARMGRRASTAPGQSALNYTPQPSYASVRPVAESDTLSPSSPQGQAFVPDSEPISRRSEAFVRPVPVREKAPATDSASHVPVTESFVPATPIIPTGSPMREAIELPPTGVGKPTTVYLNLLDQGIACLRTVQAEHLGRDFYRIVEPEPEGENWEFHPGQVVRCRKQKLSNGKALVAYEEAPRAN